jgi:hypothetical protein
VWRLGPGLPTQPRAQAPRSPRQTGDWELMAVRQPTRGPHCLRLNWQELIRQPAPVPGWMPTPVPRRLSYPPLRRGPVWVRPYRRV